MRVDTTIKQPTNQGFLFLVTYFWYFNVDVMLGAIVAAIDSNPDRPRKTFEKCLAAHIHKCSTAIDEQILPLYLSHHRWLSSLDC